MYLTSIQAILVLNAGLLCHCQNIKLSNNGYDGVLVAISETVPYDPQLLPRIKTVLNDASSTLYSATKYRAYFRKITILIPSSWSMNAPAATTEIFEKANIRVDIPSARYGNNPWVKQTAGCGIPGEYMHLTPEFLINKTESERIWGPLDKVLVHEWGHLRWGLFDEYPIGDGIKEHFYFSPTTNQIEASRCSLNVKGAFRNRRTGATCKIDAVTSLYEQDCRFYANPTETKTTSSLMYYHFLPSIEQFCDDNRYDQNNYHNDEAPSQHNRLCGGRSAWTVMRESDDFKNGNNQGTDDPNRDTSITFHVVKRVDKKRVVVVMDVSGSMRTDNNYIKLAAAVKRYLLYTVQTGTSVGLVEYNARPRNITHQLRKVNNTADRHDLANKIIPKKGGNTAIGQGLLSAKELLEAGNAATKGDRIILLTDGKETETPNVAEVLPKIQLAGIIVDTILLTQQASPVVISLAAQTGGMSFYSSGSNDSTSLSDAYTKAERDRIPDRRLAPITIMSKVTKVNPQDETCFGVAIDSKLGRDSTFTFTWVNENATLSINITAPNSTVFSLDIVDSSIESGFQCDRICPTGRWEVCIKNGGSELENIVSQVESTAADTVGADESTLPITINTRIVNDEPSFNVRGGQPVTVLATVAQGYSPVTGARVTAVLESPDSGDPAVRIQLRDDGSTADVVKDDGTYSAYIFNAEKIGKHTLSVTVEGVDGQTNIKKVITMSKAASQTEPGDRISTEEIELSPVESLERSALAGFIQVKSVISNDIDMLPPARVTDLEVARMSDKDGSVTLTWTAVGDDMDMGTASSYQLWRADNHTILIENLGGARKIDNTEVVRGNLQQVSPAYQREEVTLKLEDRGQVVVFGLIVSDDEGNLSPMSNLVATRLTAVDKKPESSSSIDIGLVAGITVPLVVVIIIIVGVLVAASLRKRSKKITSRSGMHFNKGYTA